MRRITLLFLILVLVFPSVFAFSLKTGLAQSEAVFYVSPEMNSAAPGESFNIKVEIKQATNVYSWQFKLSWDPNVLEVQDVQEGDFLNQRVYKTIFQNYTYNEAGNLVVVCVLRGEPRTASASGDGTLATVTLYVKDTGYSNLQLFDTEMYDYELDPLPSTTESGYFQYGVTIPSLNVVLPSVEDPLIPGSTFNVNITVANVNDLYSWDLCLSWNPIVLNFTDIQEGGFLNQNGTQPTVLNVTYPLAGTVCVNCTLSAQPIVAASGNGTLATIVFSVETPGDTLLDLHNTTLLDSNLLEISHVSEDGYFTNVIGDIAVKSVEASTYNIMVGDTVSITVALENEGNIAEPFDVLVWANITILKIIPVTDLDSGGQKTLTIDWDTQNIAQGKYVIIAEADTIPGEADTDDNNLVMGNVIQVTAIHTTEFPTTPVIAAVTAIVLLTIILFLYRRRKRSPKA